jgi:hypothetical protein
MTVVRPGAASTCVRQSSFSPRRTALAKLHCSGARPGPALLSIQPKNTLRRRVATNLTAAKLLEVTEQAYTSASDFSSRAPALA